MSENYKNAYWSTQDAQGFHSMKNPQDAYVSPHIAKIIEELNVKNLLDYGCGGAYLDKILPHEIKKTLYDIFPDAIPDDCEKFNAVKVLKTEELASESFDCIFAGMMFVCIKTEDEFNYILGEMRRLLKKGGWLVISDPHPCFRWQAFRYNNNKINEENFTYFDEGRPFYVMLSDMQGNEVYFNDYHHSLSFFVNKFAEYGLYIQKMQELRDYSADDKPANKMFPPYYLLTLQKH